jgi:hypothetical protein
MPKKNIRQKVAIKTETSLTSKIKIVTGMTLMMLMASAAISGILTWYLFQ